MDVLYRGPNSIVYRTYSEQLGKNVIIKRHNEECQSSIFLRNKFAKEFKTGCTLAGPHVVPYISLEIAERTEYIVMEDTNSLSLEAITQQKGPMEINSFCKLALSIIDAVTFIHSHKLFHGFLSPLHIIWDLKDDVRLIDLSMCSELVKDSGGAIQTKFDKVLAFVSPEQTGKMNREVDYRTDFYSLGAIFYYIITKKTPFESSSGLDLLYSIIAKQPKSPHERNPNIPKEISDIIMHLLQKNADDRYQSTYGIKKDIEQFMTKSGPFKLAEHDICSEFHISQRLYGRTNELNTLLDGFERIASGQLRSMLLLVAGYSGIGKTSLINEVHKPLVKRKGFLISGKFDQFKRSDVPFGCFILAFQQLIMTLLTETEEEIKYWRTKLTNALGNRAQIMIDVIPEIALIIGRDQPKVAETGAEENLNRFKATFQSFVGVFSQKEHPLVIFLDDLQWADLATLQLLEMLITSPVSQYLLIFGAYRDNEVKEMHPLVITVKKIEEACIRGTAIDKITLKPLEIGEITAFVADSIHTTSDDKDTIALSQLVLSKTDGNPFFMIMYLQQLYKDNLIEFDFEHGKWKFDVNQIQRNTYMTENVVEMMTNHMLKLPYNTQMALSLAACIGSKFEFEFLSLVYHTIEGENVEKCAQVLWPVIREGLIVQLGQRPLENKWLNREDLDGAMYSTHSLQFLHDRVQQAAFELVDKEKQELIHVTIGRLLLTTLSPEERDEKLFDILSHFKIAQASIVDEKECIEISTLNLKAARRAKGSTAYHLAAEFALFGVFMLRKCTTEEGMWQEPYYQLTFDLYKEVCECEYLRGGYVEAEKLYPLVEDHARNLMDQIEIRSVRAQQYELQQRYKEMIAVQQESLERLTGVRLPYYDYEEAKLMLGRELAKVDINLRGRKIADLIDSPPMSDPKNVVTMKILKDLHASSYVIGELDVYSTIGAMMTNMSLIHGHCENSAAGYAYYGLASAESNGDFESAYEFGLLSVKLSEMYDSLSLRCWVLHYFAVTVNWYRNPLSTSVEYLTKCFHMCLECGELALATYSFGYIPFYQFSYDSNLNNVFDTRQKCLTYLEANNPYFCSFSKQITLPLTVLWSPQASSSFVQESVPFHNYVEDKLYEQYKDFSMVKAGTFIGKLISAFIKGEREQWIELADLSWDNIKSGLRYLWFVPVAQFYIAIVYMLTSGLGEEYIQRVTDVIASFKRFNELCPLNFEYMYLILLAVQHQTNNDLQASVLHFERAIISARTYKQVYFEALANELLANVWSKFSFASKYHKDCMTTAYKLYHMYGAVYKVETMSAKYSFLPKLDTYIPRVLLSYGNERAQKEQVLSNSFDILSIMEAGRLVSNETLSLEQFLDDMMKIIVQNTAATRGVYIKVEANVFTVVAEGNMENMQIDTLRAVPLEEYKNICKRIVYYVERTKESVVIGKSNKFELVEGKFRETEELDTLPRSVLCLPILNHFHAHEECRGILYLESDIVDDAFTEKRAEVMSLLASQIAISLESARFSDLLQSEKKFKQTATQLQKAKRQLEEFIDVLCHELRNPLNSIIGYKDILADLCERIAIHPERYEIYMSQFAEALKYLSTASDNLKEIIDTVLTVSMLENKSVKLQTCGFEPTKVIQEVVHMFETKAQDGNIVLQNACENETLYVSGDPYRFKELLINLISSSLKFTGGEIIISSKIVNRTQTSIDMMFAVTDTGINVSSSEMADIVQIFFVEENAVSETYFTKYDGGIRLGLRICKELCELMGSRMIVRSDSGKGTIFEFSLTFGLLETELEEEPDLDREYKILIAEDHPINQKILARLLAKDGYTSEVANNGAEAVRMIVSGSYDAVLMDLEMPILSGMDATRRVREMEAERGMTKMLPIIGVSGNSREEYMPKCLKAGMQGYITKPYVHQDIFDALAQCLRPRRVV